MGVTVKQKANDVFETSKDIKAFAQFQSIVDLGITIGLGDIPFERAMLFTWIKEVRSVRKT